MKIQKQLDIRGYSSDGFIGKYQRLIRDTVIPYQHSVLWDKAPDTEKSHAVQNFINAAKALKGEDVGDGFYGMVFQDSDAAKWIEAAAYSLSLLPSEELERSADELIDIIAEAQDKDGYLDTYFTVKDREKRWTNLLEAHELYCMGHMMEAACAYFEATGKDKLLKVMTRCAEHIYNVFITEKHEGFPGHPEVELALMKMYRLTGNEHCLELCRHFIDVRGVDPDYYRKEREKRDWTVWGSSGEDGRYQQSHAPVREQTDADGHAVRAVYLYTAMADLASETGDDSLYEACRRLWRSIADKRMYITGGIGSTVHGEAFSVDYDLPPDTAYCETCASIGLMFFASRMLENEIDGEYGDIMERAFYNTVLAGMQLDGKRFFYVNPLEVIPNISGKSAAYRHDLPTRPKWYACACCPPNAARLISSFGKYAYGESGDTVYCHLFAGGKISFENGMGVTCETGYPYNFTVNYDVTGKSGTLAVRIPSWSRENCTIEINGEKISPDIKKGYAYIAVNTGDKVKLTLDGRVRKIYPSPKLHAVSGMTALCRGPLVYCFEGVDNEGCVTDIALCDNGKTDICPYDEELLGGTAVITAEAVKLGIPEGLYSETAPEERYFTAKAVPYYTWGNRGENEMRVWAVRGKRI